MTTIFKLLPSYMLGFEVTKTIYMNKIEIDSNLSYDIMRNEYTIVNIDERVAVVEDNFKKFMLKSSIIGITSKVFPIINN